MIIMLALICMILLVILVFVNKLQSDIEALEKIVMFLKERKPQIQSERVQGVKALVGLQLRDHLTGDNETSELITMAHLNMIVVEMSEALKEHIGDLEELEERIEAIEDDKKAMDQERIVALTNSQPGGGGGNHPDGYNPFIADGPDPLERVEITFPANHWLSVRALQIAKIADLKKNGHPDAIIGGGGGSYQGCHSCGAAYDPILMTCPICGAYATDDNTEDFDLMTANDTIPDFEPNESHDLQIKAIEGLGSIVVCSSRLKELRDYLLEVNSNSEYAASEEFVHIIVLASSVMVAFHDIDHLVSKLCSEILGIELATPSQPGGGGGGGDEFDPGATQPMPAMSMSDRIEASVKTMRLREHAKLLSEAANQLAADTLAEVTSTPEFHNTVSLVERLKVSPQFVLNPDIEGGAIVVIPVDDKALVRLMVTLRAVQDFITIYAQQSSGGGGGGGGYTFEDDSEYVRLLDGLDMGQRWAFRSLLDKVYTLGKDQHNHEPKPCEHEFVNDICKRCGYMNYSIGGGGGAYPEGGNAEPQNNFSMSGFLSSELDICSWCGSKFAKLDDPSFTCSSRCNDLMMSWYASINKALVALKQLGFKVLENEGRYLKIGMPLGISYLYPHDAHIFSLVATDPLFESTALDTFLDDLERELGHDLVRQYIANVYLKNLTSAGMWAWRDKFLAKIQSNPDYTFVCSNCHFLYINGAVSHDSEDTRCYTCAKEAKPF